jgi:hypothetical protein
MDWPRDPRILFPGLAREAGNVPRLTKQKTGLLRGIQRWFGYFSKNFHTFGP